MANAHSHDSHDSSHGSVKSYAIGFILSVILTVIPFGLVMYPTLPKDMTLLIIVAFAPLAVQDFPALQTWLKGWIMPNVH